ncbi:MAG: hypothetical protein HYU66_25010, partial [Armatimonadetes bacterium]|nr:hypothetical protein [Armatimonadota bacterium]
MLVLRACLLVLIVAPADQADPLVGLPAAFTAARAFEGLPDLGLEYVGLDRGADVPRYDWPTYHVRSVDARRTAQGWAVDPWSGSVVGWEDDALAPDTQQRDAAYWESRRREGMLPLSALQRSAIECLRSRVPGVDLTAYGYHDYAGRQTPPTTFRDSYCFQFTRTRRLRGSDGPFGQPVRAYEVCVLTGSGKPYAWWRGPPTDLDLPTPRTSAEEAESASLALLNRPGVAYVRCLRTVLTAVPSCRLPGPTALCWRVSVEFLTAAKFRGVGQEHTDVPLGMVTIDAMTGAVLEVDMGVGVSNDTPVLVPTADELAAFRSTPTRPRPVVCKLFLNGVDFLLCPPAIEAGGEPCVAEAFAWQLGVRVYRHDDGRLLRGVREVVLPADQVVIRNNEAYYPLGPLATAANATVLWNKETGELRITCPYKGGLLDHMADWD